MIFNKCFVTNSSSTSFVLTVSDEDAFTLKGFLSAANVDENSPLAIIYRELYKLIKSNIDEEVFSFEEINSEEYRAFDSFSKEGEEEIRKRIKNGEKAFIGRISDDDVVGGYFLEKKIVIVGDTFYFNWEPDAY